MNVVHLTFFAKGELRRLAITLNSVYTNLVIKEGQNVQLKKKTADELQLVLQSICLSCCCTSVRFVAHYIIQELGLRETGNFTHPFIWNIYIFSDVLGCFRILSSVIQKRGCSLALYTSLRAELGLLVGEHIKIEVFLEMYCFFT